MDFEHDGMDQVTSTLSAEALQIILGRIFNHMQFCNPRKKWTYGQKLLPWWTFEKNQQNSLAIFGNTTYD